MKKKSILGLALLALFLFVGLGTAQAIPDVTPANSALNPVNEDLYVVNQANTKIDVYNHNINPGGWSIAGTPISLPAGSKAYGLAVSPDGSKLYISINAGASSKVRVHDFTNGTDTDLTGASWSSYSSPAGIALGGGSKLYLADKGIGRLRVFNTDTNTFERDITDHLAGKSNLYGVAVTAGDDNYKIYVSQKSFPGSIFVFNYSGGTITYANTINAGLAYPTYLKIVGDKLYVAVNGTDGVDVKVYSTTDDSWVGDVKSGIMGSYGWTAFDVSKDGAMLYFKKSANSSETINKLYQIKTSDISGPASATQIATDTGMVKSDGLAISFDKTKVALSDSPTGNLQIVDLAQGNNAPNASNLQQYKTDGTTIIPKTPPGTTTENRIRVKFVVTDSDGDNELTPIVWYRKVTDVSYTKVYGPTTPSGGGVDMIIPDPANPGFDSGNYEWGAGARDSLGAESGIRNFGADIGATDFVVNYVPPDTTPPEAINDLIAAVGDTTGTIKVRWTAVADDGNSPASGPASSYIVKYSYTGPITTDTLFDAATPHAQNWTPKAPGEAENYVIDNLTAGAKIWVSIKAVDEVNNIGPLGNSAVTIVKNYVPPPTITKIYPNKGPSDRDNHIIIEGDNMWNTFILKIGTNPATILDKNVHWYSEKMIGVDIPSGIADGTYEIIIEAPGGTYDDAAHANPNNDYTVITKGADTQAPAQVANFIASDNQPAKISLSWTNPADGDLREVIVLRKEGSYPAGNSDATALQAYESMIPNPGNVVNVDDPNPITPGTTYYYAVFSRDTSDNWNDVVTATKNADTGIAQQGSSITNVSIARNGDNQGDSVTVSWQNSPLHAAADIYVLEKPVTQVLTAADFNTAGTWTKVANPAIIPSGDLDTFVDSNQVGTGTQKYYSIVPQGQPANPSINVAGKFDWTVGPEPEKLFVSLPVEPTSGSLAAVLGNQAKEFDMVVVFDIDKIAAKASMLQGGIWQILPGAGAILDNLAVGEGYGYITSTARYITVVGKVKETELTRSLTANSTANWVATPYPYNFGIANAGLDNSSNNANPTQAAMIVHFDANAEAIGSTDGIAFHTAPTEWKEGTLQNPSPLTLDPGKSYMLFDPGTSDVTWRISR